MISVRVNEILKYLSTDKKERLKRCVQVMESVQKLDNTRTQRNNITNAALSLSLSSSSSCVSVTEEERSADESTSKAPLGAELQESPAVVLTPNEGKEKKEKGRFQSDVCGTKLTKNCKKRRPLTVLKSQNIQCTSNKILSVSESSSSFSGSESQSIPKDSLLRDVKLNGLKPLVFPKSKVQANSKTDDSPDELSVKKKSDQKYENEIFDLAKDCTRLVENQKLSKQKITTQNDESQHSETDFERKLNIEEKKTDDVKGFDPGFQPGAFSPSFATSRKSRKPKKTKDSICGKMQCTTIPGVESKPLVEGSHCHRPDPAETSPNVSEKIRQNNDLEFSHKEKKNWNLCVKENGLEQKKVVPLRLNGYKSTSGVAELDTFEIRSLKKKLLKKRRADVPFSEALDELDTFDDPIVPTVHKHSNQSLGTGPTTAETTEKWIEVNRKVKRVVVPSKSIGRILGRDGSKLEAICNVTKAHIEQEKTGSAEERTFVVRGTLEQMNSACSMISALTKDCDSLDSVRNGYALHSKPESTVDAQLEKISDQPETRNSKELKARGKFQLLPVVGCTGNATGGKISSFVAPGIQGQQPGEEYQESVTSGTSERSDDQSYSARSSPLQDLLIGEYSLFEHGLGQPLEKLLACKDLSKQTFAHAAGSRSSNLTPAVAIANGRNVDQTLLAKAPGYRNVKLVLSREMLNPKMVDVSSNQSGSAMIPRKCDGQIPRNESFPVVSHLLPINSMDVCIPSMDRPISAPSQPLPHSAVAVALCSEPSVRTCDLLAIHRFSNLNPNAPDFVFASSPEANSLNHPSDFHADGLVVSSVDASICNRNVADVSCSYIAPFRGSSFKPSAEVLGLIPDDATCQAPSLVTSEETMYTLPVGDSVSSSWIYSQDSWNAPKMSFGVFGGECVSVGNFPSWGEVHRSYLTHPMLTTSTKTSPYDSVFYQQKQHVMLSPVQNWAQGSRAMAQTGP